MSRALPSKRVAAEDHAAGDERTHVSKRSARTLAQVGGASVVVIAITEITGWEPGPATATIITAFATWVVATSQTLVENLTKRTLPGPFGDGIHRRIGDKAQGLPGPTETPWADGG